MQTEVTINGLKAIVPLTPEAFQRVDRIATGLEAIRSKLPRLSSWGVVSDQEFHAIDLALLELSSMATDLLAAHRAVAAPSSPRPAR